MRTIRDASPTKTATVANIAKLNNNKNNNNLKYASNLQEKSNKTRRMIEK